MLFNCDLTIVYAKGEIEIRQANMNLNEGSKNKYKQRQFINAKIDKERYEIFVADIEHTKQELLENIDMILDKYQPRYKHVFIAYFLQDKTYSEIAEETNYSLDTINKVIRKLKDDLITFYIP